MSKNVPKMAKSADYKVVPVSQILAWKNNPRSAKVGDLRRLKKQILELGFYKPLICCRHGKKYLTLGGNHRLVILRELGIEEIMISIVTAPTDAEKLKYAISDNDNIGTWDEEKLTALVLPQRDRINLKDFKVELAEPLDLKETLVRFSPDYVPDDFKEKFKSLGKVKQEIDADPVPAALAKIPIADFVNAHENIVVTFSGGKDSVATALWALENCDRSRIRIIYCDTGIDFPDVAPYLTYCEKAFDHQIIRVGPGTDERFVELCRGYGFPGFNNMWCSVKLKTEYLFDYYKEHDLVDDRTVLIMGDRIAEGDRRRSHRDRGIFKLNMAYGKIKSHFACPLLELSDLEACQYSDDRGISLYPGYLHFDRNGCYACPSAPVYKWYIMKRLWPRLWIQAVEYLIAGTKDLKYRNYFLRDITKAAALRQEGKGNNGRAPFKAFVDCDKINAVIGTDIRGYNLVGGRRDIPAETAQKTDT